MNGKLTIPAVVLVGMTFSATGVLAQEGEDVQNFVIGAGIGSHAFTEPHRVETDSGDLEVKSALMAQFYAEWYALETIGVGIRFITFGARQTASATVSVGGTTESVTSEVEVGVDNWLVTVNWIPLGAQGYARLGVLAGAGRSAYEISDSTTPGASHTSNASGTALLLGGYVDWGADGFGARFGAQYLATDLGTIGGESVDASGREIYLDLRWAF